MGRKKKFIDKKNAVTYRLVHRSQKDPLAADDTAPHFVLHQLPKGKREKDLKLKLPSDVFPSEVEEKVGLLNKAAPIRGPQVDWDPEIVATLDDGFDFDDPDNQLEDDFILKANAVDGSVKKSNSDDEETNSESEDDDDSLCNEFFEDMKCDDAETKTQFTEYSLSSSVIRRNAGLTMLDNMFEKIYEEYEDDEIGALDQDEITGYLSTKSDVFKKIVDEYEKEEAGKKKTEFEHDMVKQWLERDDDDENKLVEKEKLVFEEPTEKWDCESILTTYSNIYNHPKLIAEPQKKITVSCKTGIPKGALNERLTAKGLAKLDKTTGTCVAPRVEMDTSMLIRTKNESKEEKLARKKAVKEHRQKRREERKANTSAFKEEKKRQEKVLLNIRQNIHGVKLI